jgi:hypothetical protein
MGNTGAQLSGLQWVSGFPEPSWGTVQAQLQGVVEAPAGRVALGKCCLGC